MFGNSAHASWYAGFARNAITFAYTDKSKYAKEMTSQNWYKILARPSVEIRRSNTDADLSGYQTVQMLNRAGKYYSAGKHAAVAEKYVAMLLGPQGQAVMKNNGFEPVSPAYPVHAEAIPAAPKTLVEPWPGL
jgi:ABC-type molybdate transport system substrate-binding protein